MSLGAGLSQVIRVDANLKRVFDFQPNKLGVTTHKMIYKVEPRGYHEIPTGLGLGIS